MEHSRLVTNLHTFSSKKWWGNCPTCPTMCAGHVVVIMSRPHTSFSLACVQWCWPGAMLSIQTSIKKSKLMDFCVPMALFPRREVPHQTHTFSFQDVLSPNPQKIIALYTPHLRPWYSIHYEFATHNEYLRPQQLNRNIRLLATILILCKRW